MDLIFLHGLGQNPSSWNETLSFLPQCIKAYCPDLLNLCEDKAYEKIYLAFENYVDNFSNPINLCGISLGAVLALNYTLNHADKVQNAEATIKISKYSIPHYAEHPSFQRWNSKTRYHPINKFNEVFEF